VYTRENQTDLIVILTALFFQLGFEAYQFSQPSSDFAVVMFQVGCFFSLFDKI